MDFFFSRCVAFRDILSCLLSYFVIFGVGREGGAVGRLVCSVLIECSVTAGYISSLFYDYTDIKCGTWA